MPIAPRWYAALLLQVAACSPPSEPPVPDPSPPRPDAAPELQVAEPPPPWTPFGFSSEGPIWRPESVGFYLNHTVYGARAVSSEYRTMAPIAEQRRALESLLLTSTVGSCGVDGEHGLLIVYDRGGQTRRYVWSHSPCGGLSLINQDGYAALRATVPSCLSTLPSTDGCVTTMGYGQTAHGESFEIKTVGIHAVSLTACEGGTPVLWIADRLGRKVKSQAAADACARIVHAFETLGRHTVWPEVTDDGGWGVLSVELVAPLVSGVAPRRENQHPAIFHRGHGASR